MDVPRFDVAIVGAGATGVMLADQLVRKGGGRLRIALLDRGPTIGLGVAYATACPDHLLNVRADNMSAVAGEPDHFVAWLAAHGRAGMSEAFLPRMVYGEYLRSVLAAAVQVGGGALRPMIGEVGGAAMLPDGARLDLADGRAIAARAVVLATGHQPPGGDSGAYRGDPWSADVLDGLDPAASVLLIGTSLTMVDIVVSLLERGHTGAIAALSRRGLLPRTHPNSQVRGAGCEPGTLFVGSLSDRLRAFRRLVAAGSSWEEVMGKLRPHNAALWNSLDDGQKRRFLRHLRPWWDVHRHRLAPAIGRTIGDAQASGQLCVLAGRVGSQHVGPAHVAAEIRRRGGAEPATRRFDRVIDCSGPRNGADGRARLQAGLMRAGLLCNDPLGLGIDVDGDDAVRGADGNTSGRLFALGPPTRGRHWEINAVPDIRERAARLAAHLVQVLDVKEPAAAAPTASETIDRL